jgi:hypothetical protein
MKVQAPRSDHENVQFSLAALLEFATLCGILSALFRASGIVASVFLMAMALALGARQGWLAVIMFMAASLAADVSAGALDPNTTLQRQATVILIASLLCGWYLLRRRFPSRPVLSQTDLESAEIPKSTASPQKGEDR